MTTNWTILELNLILFIQPGPILGQKHEFTSLLNSEPLIQEQMHVESNLTMHKQKFRIILAMSYRQEKLFTFLLM